MHRTRTRLSKRLGRGSLHARRLEDRGVRLTYKLHDELLSNPSSRRRFARDAPQLDDLQQRIVAQLDSDGCALTTFSELFPDGSVWHDIEAFAQRFVTETAEGLARDSAGGTTDVRRHGGKEFVVRRYAYGVTIGDEDPWFRVALSRRMLDIANAYLRLWSKLEYVDYWYSVPDPDAKRTASQLWHRDHDDQHLLKAFLYLVDVGEDSGPFEFLPGSARVGRYADLCPWHPQLWDRPPQDEIERVAVAEARTFTAPKGTVIFCNTSGLHRGGYATGRPRVLATATYCSPASLKSLTERNYRYTGAATLDSVQRYALS